MSDNSARIASAVLGILVAIGLALAGYFVSTTLYKARLASNTVTVKGFAERDVKADLALWEISYSITGGDLSELYAQSSRNQATITALLTGKGFRPVDIKPAGLEVNDLLANQYRANNVSAAQRYILKNTLTVRSVDVERVEATTQSLNDLIRQGIVLTGNNVDYQFTKLNDIKAPMLKDATQNARDAAQQFANDAGSRVGSIQSASQGLFSVNSRDSSAAQNPDGGPSYSAQKSTIDKRVRVVVTLTYYLDR